MTTNELRDLIKECIVEAANTSELEKLGFEPVKESPIVRGLIRPDPKSPLEGAVVKKVENHGHYHADMIVLTKNNKEIKGRFEFDPHNPPSFYESIKSVNEEGGYEDQITNAMDRQKYVALRKMEKAHLLKSKMTKDTKRQNHLDMANQYLDQAMDIARKYGAVNEDDTDGLSEMKLVSEVRVSKELEYHLVKKLSLTENVFRTYSDAYFALINEVRELYHQNKIELCDPDAELVESDLGKKAIYEGREVYLDAPIEEEEDLMMEVKHRGKNVHLNRPFRTPGGPKKYAVYVKSKGGNIKKVTFGDPNMRSRASSKARRKSFAARHKCSQKKDRTTAGYWSCRSHRIKSLGNKGKGRYW